MYICTPCQLFQPITFSGSGNSLTLSSPRIHLNNTHTYTRVSVCTCTSNVDGEFPRYKQSHKNGETGFWTQNSCGILNKICDFFCDFFKNLQKVIYSWIYWWQKLITACGVLLYMSCTVISIQNLVEGEYGTCGAIRVLSVPGHVHVHNKLTINHVLLKCSPLKLVFIYMYMYICVHAYIMYTIFPQIRWY